MTEEDTPTPVDSHSDKGMVRPSVPAADAQIGVKHRVLEHGYVVLVDYMGNDNAIVQAARVSYGLGTKTARTDRALIRYLMRHDHTTPFEMVEFKFLIRLPIYVARQFIRHRTASVNEYSARYSVVPEEFELPSAASVRGQAASNRQGRSNEALPDPTVAEFRDGVTRIGQESYGLYKAALDKGVARELARIVLPVSYYTEWYWKCNLHNLFHFLKLRLDEHAQEEIRSYAKVMAEVAKTVVPVAYEAFEDYHLNSQKLSSIELRALSRILKGEEESKALEEVGLPLTKPDGKPLISGEGVEFREKLSKLRARKEG